MSIKQIFDEIASTSSTTAKMDILRKYSDNELLKRVLYMANSKRVKFYIKQIPEYSKDIEDGMFELDHVLNKLQHIANREYTGSDAIKALVTLLNRSSNDDRYIIERIIEKDCKINLGTRMLNKVFPKLIEDTPYMGAKSYDPKLVKKLFENGGTAFSQVKMDGRYCNAIIRGGEVEMESRQGEPTVFAYPPTFVKDLSKLGDCVLNGELTIPGISRYESNGIIASLVTIGKKKLDGKNIDKEIREFEAEHMPFEKAHESIVFTSWDSITVFEYFEAKSIRPYSDRFTGLEMILNGAKLNNVKLVETKLVSSFEEAMAHFQELLNRGEEGTIVKAEKGEWKDGKPNWQIKCKLEMDIDLRIIGFNYGTGKNEKVISSVNAQSSDGKVNTRPTGMDEKLMAFVTENQDKLLNTILEVKCSGLSHDSEGNYALLHPVFKKLRDDKDTCDSLDSIKKIEAMAKGLA